MPRVAVGVTPAKRWGYEWTVTSAQSGLSNEAAVAAYSASANRQPGDQIAHRNLPSSRREFRTRSIPRGKAKYQ
jgi:hypothetical protein